MAEDAILRIVLEGEGGGGGDSGKSTPSGSTGPTPSNATSPGSYSGHMGRKYDPADAQHALMKKAVDDKLLEEERKEIRGRLYPPKPPKPPEPPDPPYDPEEAARKAKQRRDEKAARDLADQKLYPDDPSGALNKRAEAERKRTEAAENKAQHERDMAEEKRGKDAARAEEKAMREQEMARKRADNEARRAEKKREQERNKADREREREISRTLAASPDERAKRRRERERQAAQTDEAYKKEYGGPSERGSLDLIFTKMSVLRGTLGGLMGTTIGAALDVFHMVRREQFDQEAKRKRRQLLLEADAAAADKYGETAEKYNNDPSLSEKVRSDSSLFEVTKAGVGIGSAVSKSKMKPLPDATSLMPTAETKSIEKSGDPSEAIGGLTGAIEKFGGAVPIIGAALIGVAAVGNLIGSLMSSFNRMAENYGQYNPEIAQAQALVEIRKTLNDMRRAQESGSQFAALIEAQADVQQKWEDIKLKISMVIIPVLTEILRAVGSILGIIEDNQQFDIKDPTDLILNDPELVRRGQGATSPLSAPQDIIGGLGQ